STCGYVTPVFAFIASTFSRTLVFTDLNGPAVRTKTNVWPASAYRSPSCGITPAIVHVQAEVVYLNLAAGALGVKLEACFFRQSKLNSAVNIADVNRSQRRFGLQLHHAIAIVHFHVAGDIVQMNFVRARIQSHRASDGAGTQVTIAHLKFTIQFGQLQVCAN